MPSSIAQIQAELKGKGLVVLAVSIEEPAAKVGGWASKVSLPFPVFLDEDGTARRAWKVSSTPTVFLLDRQGRMTARGVGTKPWASAPARALFTALLVP